MGYFLQGELPGRIFIDVNTRIKFFSGGGSYDIWIGGSSIKVGMWIELNDRFKWDLQVIEKGEYKNGKKFGRWDTSFRL